MSGWGILLVLLAGSGIFLGALLASYENIKPDWLENELRHTLTATGGGALIAAVTLMLAPNGMASQGIFLGTVTFLGGGLGALLLDKYLSQRQGPASQLTALMLDFIPESLVIGSVVTKNWNEAVLISALVFSANLPESFHAYREISQKHGAYTGKKLLIFFLLFSISGPLYVGAGFLLLTENASLIGAVESFCAGAILYLVFNDIAPQIKLKNHWAPSLGALLGFLVGLIGKQLV